MSLTLRMSIGLTLLGVTGCFEPGGPPPSADTETSGSGTSGAGVCIPGVTRPCECAANQMGVQVCADDGTRFEACSCDGTTSATTPATETGNDDASSGGNESGTTSAVEDSGDTTTDATTTVDGTTEDSVGDSTSMGSDCNPACAMDEACLEDICVGADEFYVSCPDGTCQFGFCVVDGMMSSVCTAQCEDEADCPATGAGLAPARCIDVTGEGGPECVLDCSGGQACPVGMECVMSSICMWPG
jgi:hypothetical protein